MNVTPIYLTGEPIQIGDAVRIGQWDGVVELVVTKGSTLVEHIDEGVMLVGQAFGRLHTRFDDEDLVFVSRTKV